MRVATKEELLNAPVPTAEVLLPELGDDVGVVVHAYTIDDVLYVNQMAVQENAEGKLRLNAQNNRLLSIIRAVQDPVLTMEDTERLLKISDAIGDRIINKALELGGATQSAFDELKETLRKNPYMRRLYAACARVFHCLPSDLASKSEAEFNTAIAALEIEAEETEKEVREELED